MTLRTLSARWAYGLHVTRILATSAAIAAALGWALDTAIKGALRAGGVPW